MSLFKAPVKIIKDIITIQSRFLWGGNIEKKIIAWVSWYNIRKPKEEGELGVKHIGYFNKALICKWKWRILKEHGSLWRKYLESRYGDLVQVVLMGSNVKLIRKDSVLWKDMITTSLSKTNAFDCFAGNVSFKLGFGNLFLFWYSRWLEGDPLKSLFPLLFVLSHMPKGKVLDMSYWQDDVWRWDFHMEVDVMLDNPEEVIEAFKLTELLAAINPSLGNVDSASWWRNGDGIFSVKSYNSIISDRELEVAVDTKVITFLNKF